MNIRLFPDKAEDALLPPPWRLREDGIYFNEVTSEESEVHPMKRFFETQATQQDGHIAEEHEEDIDEFRCTWQEIGLSGSRKTYGATIRYNITNGHGSVKLDGVDGEWRYTSLEGPNGPLERHDLFLGAKVTLFGRHLTIQSSNLRASVWIEEEGKRLRDRQEWMQTKLESIGVVPCVRRPTAQAVKHITRKPTVLGCVNLRRLVNENTRLGEQLARTGLVKLL